jgi:hypothetical protein
MAPRQPRRNRQQQELLAIVDLHKEALSYFEKGNIDTARDYFNSCFSSITRLLRETLNRDVFYYRGSPLVRESSSSPTYESSSSSSSPTGTIETTTTGKNNHHSEFALPIVTAAATTSSASPSTCESDDLPMYHRALLHLPKLGLTINQFVFCTLYNLAMSTHLSALAQETQAKQEASMRRAAKQWGLVYALQWRHGLNLRPSHGLAILLNLGHAKSLIVGKELGSKMCYQNILSAIHILDSRKQNIPNKALFLYNAFRMLGGPNTIIAASAA